MSLWKLIARNVGGVTGKIGEKIDPKHLTQDSGLPLGGRIGGYMKIGNAAFLTASLFGSFITKPETGEVKIEAISRVRLDGWPGNVAVHRYYLAKGDDSGKERYIQVLSRNGQPEEVIYFTSLVRLYPDDSNTIKYYSGELGSDGIGGTEWVFSRDDLQGILSGEQFQSLPADQQEIVWQRAVGEGEHFLPIHGVENRIDDSVGDKGIHQQVWCMPHIRQLSEGVFEHLFVSLEVMDSHDGKREQEVHVDFMVGVPLSMSDIQIV